MSPVRASWALLLVACAPHTPPSSPAAAPDDEGPDFEAACVDAVCVGAEDPAACALERCTLEPAVWRVVPDAVRLGTDPDTVSIQAHLDYTPARRGPVERQRQRPVFVGVTVITATGREVDLTVSTLFPGAFDTPILLSAEVDADDVQDVIIGAWGQKVQPCDSERSGCQEYGFLLDHSMAAWPPGTYVDGRRQRIVPESVTLQLQSAGAASLAVDEATGVTVGTLEAVLRPFGSQAVVAPAGIAPAASEVTRLVHHDPHDAVVAESMAAALGESLGVPVEVAFDPESPLDWVLQLGGSAERWSCLVETCPDDVLGCDRCP